jgi:hypothetical protein
MEVQAADLAGGAMEEVTDLVMVAATAAVVVVFSRD